MNVIRDVPVQARHKPRMRPVQRGSDTVSIPPIRRENECPKCWAVFARADDPPQKMQEKYRQHFNLNHKSHWVFEGDGRRSPVSSTKPETTDLRAGAGAKAFDPPRELREITQKLPFHVLPSGAWDLDSLVARCRQAAVQHRLIRSGDEFEPQRLKRLLGAYEKEKLRPHQCWIGLDKWIGYVVLEFPWTRNVVVECPIRGHATYILAGDWRAKLCHTRAYLRAKMWEECTRVMHRGDWSGWESGVRAALRRGRRRR